MYDRIYFLLQVSHLKFSLDNSLCIYSEYFIQFCTVIEVTFVWRAVILLAKFEIDNAPIENLADISTNRARQ